MAFVKVVRRSMRPEEWTELRYGWIKRGMVQRQSEIQELEIRDARQTGENTFVFDNEYRPLKQGDLYFIPDGTIFIRGRGFVPDTLRGQEVWLQLHTASEMLVKINGQLAGGIDPNRDRILLNPWLEGPAFTLEIQGFYRSKPDDERNPEAMDSRGCRQVFDGAYLCLVNQPLQNLYYDLTLLLDIAQSDEFEEDYRVFLNRELNQALNLIDFDSWTGVDHALQYIEEHIYQNADFRSSGNVALVAHSHLDIAYYWRRMHVVQKNARTILIQLRLMDRYPDFKYAHTQPYTYELLKQNYPDLFTELKAKIQCGQFEPIGAMYVEPDCNLPAAESLIRQCLYGQAFYRQEFGFTVDNAWLPDVFGNSWILPQILRKSGVKYFVSNKMSTWNDTNRFPHNNFIWKGLDGSRIYACVPPTHFITWNMPSQIMENWHAYQDKEVGGQTLSMFGYGDGGSGVTEEMIELMHRFSKLSSMPQTEHCSADEFLHKNLAGRKDLAVWDGELYLEMHRGTFTTKSQLKALNRQLESKIRLAELVCSLALLQRQQPYPAAELRAVYKKLLVNQFHDILPGSHIHPVYEDAMQDYVEINTRLEQLVRQATKALCNKPSGAHGLAAPRADRQTSAPRYWFNPLNFQRQQMTFFPDEQGWATRQGVRGFYAAPTLPALGSVAVACPPEGKTETGWLTIRQCAPVQSSSVQTGVLQVQTPYYRLQLNPDGSFASLFDTNLQREWTAGPFNQLRLYQDVPGMYDAWDILPNYKDVAYDWQISQPLQLEYKNHTLAQFSVTLLTPGGRSSWTMKIRVFRESRLIEVEHQVDWQEKHRLVKADFNCKVLSRELICDTSAGYIRRDCHQNTSWQQARFEVCSHKWCDFAEASGGIALINQGKYGLGVQENGMSLSLLRATIRPDVSSDMGHHNFSYVILPHAGNHLEAGINQQALAYNTPLLQADLTAPAAWDFSPLYLQAVKLSEDEHALVFRLSEQDGQRGHIQLPAPLQQLNMLEDVESVISQLDYAPFELITLGWPLDQMQV